jgi:hypothetical protein
MTRFRRFVLVAALAALSSCSRGPASAAGIPGEKFVRLYADLLIAREERALRGLSVTDSTARDSVCRAYGVTPADVAATLEQYKGSLASWKEFHVSVTKRLEALQQEMAAKRIPKKLP